MNIVMYAHRGTMTLSVTPASIVLDVRDEGPGIPDITLAMQEGYTTATPQMREMGFGAGMGLPNIKRNSDELTVTSEVGRGTHLSVRVNVS
jgi:serine/threonine-protein kinase RsbT